VSKRLILDGFRAVGGFALARALTARKLRILCYHGLWTLVGVAPFGNRLFMPHRQFAERMRWLARSPYPVLPLGEAVDMLADDRLPRGATVITVDDGWASTHTHMLPVLEALRLPATVYVSTYYVENQGPVANVVANFLAERAPAGTYDLAGLLPGLETPLVIDDRASRDHAGDRLRNAVDAVGFVPRMAALSALAERLGVGIEPWWSGRQFHLMRPDELRDAERRGIDVQLHTHRHKGLHRYVDQLPQELADNRAALARILGGERPSDHFCYPSGGYDERGEAILAAAGIKSATLVAEGLNAPGTNPYRLRRFLDGRTVSETSIDAYLSGALDIGERLR
jgi:peptidoglycan/xylan/chitin deacetylase (PgdA/CDA1 family)